MVVGFTLIIGFILISVFAYKQSKFEQKLIKHISVVDWMNLFLTPIAMYVGVVYLVKGIISRPYMNVLDIRDSTLVIVGLPFLIYAFVGLTVHFVSKVLWRNFKKQNMSMAYRVNEIFHGKLSHYLTTICGFLTLFMISLLELNHPLTEALDTNESRLMLLAGVLLGIPVARSVFYTSNWLGGNRSLFIVACIFLTVILLVFQFLSIQLISYPISLFVLSSLVSFITLFILRRVYIQAHLGNRRRLRFLAHILWA